MRRLPPPDRVQLASVCAAIVFLVLCPRHAAGHSQPHSDGDPVPPRGDYGVYADAFAAVPAFEGAPGSCFFDDQTPAESFLDRLADVRTASCGSTHAATDVALTDEGNSRSVWNLEGVTAAVGTGTTRSDTAGPAGASVDDFFEDAFLVTSTALAAVVVKKHVTATTTGDAGYDVWTDAYLVDESGVLHALTLIHPFDNTPGHDVDVVSDQFPQFDKDIEILLPPLPPGSVVLLDAGIDFTSSGPASAAASVSSTVSVCPLSAGVQIDSLSGATGDCGQPGDIALVGITPVQSVFGTSRLIAGKSTVLAIDLKSTFRTDQIVRVDLDVSRNGAVTHYAESITVPAACSKRFYFPNPLPSSGCSTSETESTLESAGIAPPATGTFQVTGTLQLARPDDNPGDDVTSSTVFEIDDTDLRVGYVRILCGAGDPCATDPANYGHLSLGEYEQAALWSNRQILGMYPVSPDGYSGTLCFNSDAGAACTINGSNQKCTPRDGCAGIVADAKASFQLVRRWVPAVNRAIAMVPEGYYRFHGIEPDPSFYLGGGTPLFDPDDPTASTVKAEGPAGTSVFQSFAHMAFAPHELAHTFDFDDLGEPPLDLPIPVPEGYWVGCQLLGVPFCETPAPPVSGQTDLVPGEPPLFALMEGHVEEGYAPPNHWIDAATYGALLARLQVDPTVDDRLLIDTDVTVDDKITVRSFDELEPGTIDPPPPNARRYSVRLLDDAGNTVGGRQFEPTFDLHFDSNKGPITSHQSVGFWDAAIDYPPATARVEFRKGDTLLLAVDPLATTLRTAIQNVNDRGFAKNPSERRKALLEKVDSIEKMIALKDFNGALQDLDHDLRDKAQDWLVDLPDNQAPLENDRKDVLETIGFVEARIRYRQQQGGKH